jgi:phosphomannomutase
MPILAFDVDGTLTEPRKSIDPAMLDIMLRLCESHKVWLVTGSDNTKCSEQVGSLFDSVEVAFCCAGAEKWSKGSLVSATGWNPPVQLIVDLFSALHDSGYSEQTGSHVEIRTGMVNLSIPGRQATQEQRQRFTAWDQKTQTRRRIANQINKLYPQAHATLGGKTGIDITEYGRGKHVILSELVEDMWFWGDEGRPGGNDYSLAEQLERRKGCKIFHTTSWQDTYHQLKELFFN